MGNFLWGGSGNFGVRGMESAGRGLEQLASSVHALSGTVAGPGAIAVVTAADKLKDGLVALASPTISIDENALLAVKNLATSLENSVKSLSVAADGIGDNIVASVQSLETTLDEHSMMWLGAILVLALVAVVLYSLAWSTQKEPRRPIEFVAVLTRASVALTIAIGLLMLARPPPLLLVPLVAATTLGLCLFAQFHESILQSVERRLGAVLAFASIALILAAIIYGAGYMHVYLAFVRAQNTAELEIRVFGLAQAAGDTYSRFSTQGTSCKSNRVLVRTSLAHHSSFPLAAPGPGFVVSAAFVDHEALDNQIIEVDVTGHFHGGGHRADITLLVNGQPVNFFGSRYPRTSHDTGDLLSHSGWIPLANRWVVRVAPGVYRFQIGLTSPRAGASDILLHSSALRIIAKCDELYDYFPEEYGRISA